MPERRIRQPIIILGSARSATTLLGSILSGHPDVAVWHELRMIWMYGHAYQSHDELGAEDVTPRIARHIDRQFIRYLERSGKSRFADKTPSNCFRVRFIHALYPDCRIVNIIRDGRNVVRSLLQVQQRKTDRTMKRLRKRIALTPIWEWPAYVPRFFRTYWRSSVLGKPMKAWGPLSRDWREWQALPRHLAVAEQWRQSVAASIRDGRALPEENYTEIRYESLMKHPEDELRSILQFADLSESSNVLNYAREVLEPGRAHRWKGTLTDEQEAEVAERLEPLLRDLGYMTPTGQPVGEASAG